MKKPIVFLILALPLCQFAFAQKPAPDDSDHRNYFWGSPFGIFASTMEAGWEHDLSNFNSLLFLGGVTMMDGNNQSRIGGSGEIQFRINMLKNPVRKTKRTIQTFTFFAPYLKAVYLDVSDYNIYYSSFYNGTNYPTTSSNTIIRSYSGGFLFGVRLSSSENRFSTSFFAGGGMKVSDVTGNQEYNDFFRPGYTGVVPRAGFQVGISF